MKSASFILGIAIACIAAPALAKPAYVASTVNLRAAPGTGSEIVAKIPGGSLVDAAACDEGWCEISWQDKKGFAIQKALDMSGRVPQQRAAAAAGAGALDRRDGERGHDRGAGRDVRRQLERPHECRSGRCPRSRHDRERRRREPDDQQRQRDGGR